MFNFDKNKLRGTKLTQFLIFNKKSVVQKFFFIKNGDKHMAKNNKNSKKMLFRLIDWPDDHHIDFDEKFKQ